jgi:hypothetical protein
LRGFGSSSRKSSDYAKKSDDYAKKSDDDAKKPKIAPLWSNANVKKSNADAKKLKSRRSGATPT